MNIVCLSTLGIPSGYIVRHVLAEHPDAKLIRLDYMPIRSPPARRIHKFITGGWLRRIEDLFFYRGHYVRHFEHVKLLLYGSSPIPAWEPAATFLTTAVNEMAMVSLLQSLQPDVLLVVGGPVLKPHIFGIPRLATINVHFGIAPYYRGEHTLFWPLYYRDYSNLGVTIHLIDRGIDTGNILAQEFLQVTGDDTPATLEAKAAQAGADLVNELLRQGDFTAHRQPAVQTRGRQFNFSSRRVWHDLLYYARRRWLAERPQETSASRVNYCGAGWEINPQPVVLSLANGFQCEQRETIH